MTTDPTVARLAKRARDGDAVLEDAATAAALLPSLTSSEDRYDALFVIGKVGDTRQEPLVTSFLDSPGDPMLARLAVQILGNWWGIGARHAIRIREFIVGVPWDVETGGYVRAAAISSAGHILREYSDPQLLAALLAVFDHDESDEMRRQAYSALLRAAGLEWSMIPGTASDAWRAPDKARLDGLRRQAGPAP